MKEEKNIKNLFEKQEQHKDSKKGLVSKEKNI
jgi:hypothetical protein